MTLEQIQQQYPPYTKTNGSRFKDETGNKFGLLSVLYRYYANTNDRKAKWVCQCDCGNITIATGKEMRSGKIVSCGCQKRERIKNVHYEDLSGQRFGALTIIKDTGIRKNGHCVWECQCDCGKIVQKLTAGLKTTYPSCGCMTNESNAMSQRNVIPIGTKQDMLTVISEPLFNDKKKTYYKCQCVCGTIIEVSSSALHAGRPSSCGCVHSKGELFTRQVLQELNIDYQVEYKFDDLLSQRGNKLKFDFAIFQNNKLQFLIEYDGIQHFTTKGWNDEERLKDLQFRDELKNQYCKQHQIPLLRIPYTIDTKNAIRHCIIKFLQENIHATITGN